jgi:DNA-nicking Smr family endonuclease
MSRRRQLTEDERTLWSGVTRTVLPLQRRRKAKAPATAAPEAAAAPEPAAAPGAAGVAAATPSPAATSARARASAQPPPAPPLAPLGRREKQRLARGRAVIDLRIDLHGMTLPQAHHALAQFLRRAQADGARIALVVTGKGARDHTGARGALRREVPMWLRMAEFRAFVIGFETAHAGHGGEGALYVRIRRRRDSGS